MKETVPANAEALAGELPIDPEDFVAALKQASGQSTREEAVARAEGSAQPSARHSVALVDAQLDIRDLLAVRLGMIPGVDVVGQAGNSREAIDLARALAPELMIIDLELPDSDRAEVVPLLRTAAPHMRVLLFTSDATAGDLAGGSRPDAIVKKGARLGLLAETVSALLAQGPQDVLKIDLGHLPVQVAVDAFDSWVGLNTRVRQALATKGDDSLALLGDVLPLNSSELMCLMGVFMQFGMPLLVASAAGDRVVDLQFTVHRGTGAAARRALLALGGNGTLRAFNHAWSHSPSEEAAKALDLIDKRLVDQLPVS